MLIVWQKKKVAFIHNIYTVFILQTKSLEKWQKETDWKIWISI